MSFFIGCFVISLVLVPELAEYAMGDPVGSGGYYVLAIGLTSFITTPVGGKLIDKLGPKPVLITGLAISTAGLAYLALIAVTAPSFATFVIGLAIVGAGMGMSMGAPTNYMILENTDKAESSSAIATITLIRQIGTSIVAKSVLRLPQPSTSGSSPRRLGLPATSTCCSAWHCSTLLLLSPCCSTNRSGNARQSDSDRYAAGHSNSQRKEYGSNFAHTC